ncbi:hypothetical protein EQM13_15930 [Acidilutibacter cellobiosedens]|uniref:Uncharacterized protein n=1 Tax=Acidilutibacter cellobiosedens TaxID=2507161 RepID=A0A410QG88_9FIRM|nr:hypothetical protein [Acidilutibacter cellobiosedens]QAT62946.1 hypothetical protein EQM13_15930 [Acidilutibacter cellobiosedens]
MSNKLNVSSIEDNIYYLNGRVYRVGNNDSLKLEESNKDNKIDMGDLFLQIKYDNEAGFINNFRDYNDGDNLYFEDSIQKLIYR